MQEMGLKKGMTGNRNFAKPERPHTSEVMRPKQRKSPQARKPAESSSILKGPVDFLNDDSIEVDFDPPLHSTAVYADGEEPSYKDLTTEKATVPPPMPPSANKKKSTSQVASGRTEDSSIHNTVIEKTQKTPSKAQCSLEEPASPGHVSGVAAQVSLTISKHNKDKRKSTSSVIKNIQSSLSDPGTYSRDSQENLSKEALPKSKTQSLIKVKKRKRRPGVPLDTPSQELGTSAFKPSHGVGNEEVHVSGVTPRSSKRARRANTKKMPTNSPEPISQSTIVSDDVNDTSSTSEAILKPRKRRRISDKSEGSLNKTQNTATKKGTKKLRTKESNDADRKKTKSLKVWSSEDVPRSSRDMNELDVVLCECEKVFEDYRKTINSDATIKVIDLFFANFKHQLTSSIEDAQKLKNLKKKNAQMRSEIGRKQKRLIEVRDEVIQKFDAVGKWIDNNCYKMDYPEKSTCLILNMKEFSNPELLRRDGTDKDAKDLRNAFERYGFRVRTEKNLTYAEIETVMEKVAAEDHSQRSCFACAVLSHGTEEGIFARDRIFRLRWLTQFISEHNCKSLAGKPKLFFIQACRGELYDQGIETDGGCEENNSLFTFVDQDFLFAYSTVPGYVAWKNTKYGSWFIQSLCKILNEHGNELELQQILTRVKCMVAKEYESSSESKEMPCVVSGLIKQLYLPVYKK